jgi:hypothetical protein
MSLKSLKVGSGIEEVAKDHEIFLLDVWGVMHNGNRPYDGVFDRVIYPRLESYGWNISHLSRMRWDMFLTAVSFSVRHRCMSK